MAWIEQTKKNSRKSGGPQYYLQGLTDPTHAALERYERCRVRIWTPYGVVDSGLEAVSSRVGKVGHDRIQSGRRTLSVADQIAFWYRLRKAAIERIKFDDSFDRDGFVILPSYVKFVGSKPRKTLYPDSRPLTLVNGQCSALWKRLIAESATHRAFGPWVQSQISEMVQEHCRASPHVDERDLLRASGALSHLGMSLGMYRRTGIDCPDATFRVGDLPPYACPVEIEEYSSGFLAAHHRDHRKKRVVLLCMVHDAPEILRDYIDIIELRELDRVLREVA